MNKIKEFFANIWGYIVLIGGGIIAILLYMLNLKNKKLEAAKAEIALATTQKDADVIEAQIKEKMAQRADNKKEMAVLEKSLDLLEQRRQNLKDERKNDQEKEDYWNKPE